MNFIFIGIFSIILTLPIVSLWDIKLDNKDFFN